MPEKPTVIEKTIIKEIHDTPIEIDLTPINNKLDALFDMVATLSDDVDALKEPKDTANPESTENNTDIDTIMTLLAAIAEAVGEQEEPASTTEASTLLIKGIYNKLLEIISNQEIIIESNNEIKDIL